MNCGAIMTEHPAQHASQANEDAAMALALPAWACVSEKRRRHIMGVVHVIATWAATMHVSDAERRDWRDAALWHDALKDAAEAELRALVDGAPFEVQMLHGPAAAARLVIDGERRENVLDAIRFHTVGSLEWDRTGRALYMADFLEPGRKFRRRDREFLARQVPSDFDGVFREVVRMRIEWSVQEGYSLFPQTIELWNAVR